MRKLMTRNYVMMVVAVVMIAGIGNVVMGDTPIYEPRELTGSGQAIAMTLAGYPGHSSDGSLMERVYGVDYVVDKGAGEYYIFFLKNVSGELVFGAYIGTDNDNNNNWGYEGWCRGTVNRDKFLDGESADYIFGMYDPDGGRFAVFDGITGQIVFDENIVTWESGARFTSSGDIEYGGVLGGLLDYEFGPISGDVLWIDSIVLVPAPIALVAPSWDSVDVLIDASLEWVGDEVGVAYDVYLSTDSNALVLIEEDLIAETLDVSSYLDWATTYYWRVDKIVGGVVEYSTEVWPFTTAKYKCQEDILGDLNGDCIVDLVDFALMAENWMAEALKIPDIP